MFLKAFFYAALIFIFTAAVYAEDSGKREKVVILPFQNDTDTKQFKNSGVFRKIFSRTFFTFISILPVIDVPDMGRTNDIAVSFSNIQAFSDSEKARIVIYGRYRLSGPKANPKIIAELTAYDGAGRTNIFSKIYETTTGPDVFEDIENMISEVMKSSLNIDVKNIAAINFMNFRIANETYQLYVNGRLIASPSNTNFSLVLRVMPQTNYSILLKQPGGRTILKTDVRLALNGSTNIGYSGYGSVRIGGIYLKDRLKTYGLFFDSGQVSENSYLSNVPTAYAHNLTLAENLTNTNYTTNIDVYDNQITAVTPAAGAYGSLHAELLSLDFDMASLIFEFFPFDRYFFVGAGGGFYYAAGYYYDISPLLEIGYYWIGDMAYNFRIGTGIIGRANLALPLGAAPVPGSVTPALFNIGLFISIDFYFLTLRPECYVYRNDSGQFTFAYTAAVGLHF